MASGGVAAALAVKYRKRKGTPVITSSHFLSAGKKRLNSPTPTSTPTPSLSKLAAALPPPMAAAAAMANEFLIPPLMAPSKRPGPLLREKSDDESSADDDHDESMVVAARVLQEFRDFPRPPKSSVVALGEINLTRTSSTPSTWALTKTRSRVPRRARSSSLDATTTTTSPAAIENGLAEVSETPELMEAPKIEVAKVEASSLGRPAPGVDSDSKLGKSFVLKVEKEVSHCNGGNSSSLSVEVLVRENLEDVVEEKVALQVLEMDPFNEERLHKLVSDSSNESPSRGSPIQRPSSPVAVMSHPAEISVHSGWTIFDAATGGNPAGRSAFQKVVVPIRPVKKPTGPRKLKVEDKSLESPNSGEAEVVKPVAKKKLKSTGNGLELYHHRHQQQQVHLQLQLRQPLAPTKSEKLDAILALDINAEDPTLAAEKGKSEAWSETTNSVVPVEVANSMHVFSGDEKSPTVGAPKAAAGSTGRPGYRGVGKPKAELNEDEQEARRLKRAQANRESARQTIRRKQHLTEERSKTAQSLAKDNETLRKEVELMRIKYENLRQMHAHLTEQVANAAVGSVTGQAPQSPPVLEKEAPPSNLQFCLPALEGGIAYNPFLYAVMGQPSEAAAAAAKMSFTDMGVDARGFAPMLGIPGTTIPASYLSVASATSSAAALSTYMPSFIAGAIPTGPSPSAAAPLMMGHSPLERSVSLPVPQGDSKYSLLHTDREMASANSLVTHRSGDFGHLTSDLKRSASKGDVSYSGSPFGYNSFNSTSPPQPVNELRGAVSLPIRKPGDNSLSFLTSPNAHFSRSHSVAAALDHAKTSFSGYPRLGAQSSEAQKAAAKARRQRMQIFKSKQQKSNNASSTPAL